MAIEALSEKVRSGNGGSKQDYSEHSLEFKRL
jgi:hypothetical protein